MSAIFFDLGDFTGQGTNTPTGGRVRTQKVPICTPAPGLAESWDPFRPRRRWDPSERDLGLASPSPGGGEAVEIKTEGEIRIPKSIFRKRLCMSAGQRQFPVLWNKSYGVSSTSRTLDVSVSTVNGF